MAFRNLSSSETASEQFEVACNFETTVRLSWNDTTACTERREELMTGVCCYAKTCIGILVNVRFY